MTGSRDTAAAAAEAERLRGWWRWTGYEPAASDSPVGPGFFEETPVPPLLVWIDDGPVFHLVFLGAPSGEGRARLDPQADPKRFSLALDTDANAGEPRGVYRLEGDRLLLRVSTSVAGVEYSSPRAAFFTTSG